MKQDKLQGILIGIGCVLGLEIVLNLKLLGISNDILGAIALVLIPALGMVGLWAAQIIDIYVVPKGKTKKIPIYTFVEVETEFKKKQEWPMRELETGKEIKIE